MDDAAVWIRAALELEGMGAARLHRLQRAYGSVPAAVRAAAGAARPPDGVPSILFAKLARLDRAAAARDLAAVRGAGIEVIDWCDARYPAPLRSGPRAPPPLLYVQGTLPPTFASPADRVRAAAVVGTRRPTGRGRALAHELAEALASLGVTVVSGLALGIDGAAHEGALAGDGPTVAVLGGGHAHLHPPSHRALAERMLLRNGALISEHPPDTRPERHRFPERNRLVSGLARLVVVVEAGLRSGTASTVDHALEQQRDVFACPGRPGDPSVAGTLRFLRDGALIVSELEDVLGRFRDGPTARREPAPDPLLDALASVAEASIDDLAGSIAGGVAALLARLTELELRGTVVRTPAGRYRLSAAEQRMRSAVEG